MENPSKNGWFGGFSPYFWKHPYCWKIGSKGVGSRWWPWLDCSFFLTGMFSSWVLAFEQSKHFWTRALLPLGITLSLGLYCNISGCCMWIFGFQKIVSRPFSSRVIRLDVQSLQILQNWGCANRHAAKREVPRLVWKCRWKCITFDECPCHFNQKLHVRCGCAFDIDVYPLEQTSKHVKNT